MTAERKIAFIRLHESIDGDALIRSDRRQINVKTTVLNGAIPGFLVEYGGGLERFYPASNVMSAEIEHSDTDRVLVETSAMTKLADQIAESRANIREVTVDDLKAQIESASAACARAESVASSVPRDGQIGKDRKQLVDALARANRRREALAEMLPAAEERPRESRDQAKKAR